VSTDGGQTFTEPTTAFYNNMTYWDADGGIDVYGMPNADCDISGGPYHGTIYISQCQIAEGSTEEELDVTVRKSTDKGETWTDRQVVNDDPPLQNKDQFHPWLVVNEDGVVLLIFYDQRDDPAHYLFNSYFSASFDGGETYIHNSRISDVSINPSFAFAAPLTTAQRIRITPSGRLLEKPRNIDSRAGLFAEYIGISANHDTVSTIWTDTRNGNQDSYYARFMMPFERPRLYLPENGALVADKTPAFRWSTCWHETADSYRLELSSTSDFATVGHMYSGRVDNNYAPDFPIGEQQWYWRVKAFRIDGDSTDYSETFSLTVVPETQCGDADGDLLVNVTDAVYIIQYIFNGGAAPDPLSIADVNCDGSVNITDAVYLVAYIFASGPVPCADCP
ncbi:MAG: dockerin type I domain-containing protein, partial [bacterium]